MNVPTGVLLSLRDPIAREALQYYAVRLGRAGFNEKANKVWAELSQTSDTVMQ